MITLLTLTCFSEKGVLLVFIFALSEVNSFLLFSPDLLQNVKKYKSPSQNGEIVITSVWFDSKPKRRTRRCSTETSCQDTETGTVLGFQWSRTTRHHQSLTETCPLQRHTKTIQIFTKSGRLTELKMHRWDVFQCFWLELTDTPLPLSGVVKLLPQHQEINNIRHVVISARRQSFTLQHNSCECFIPLKLKWNRCGRLSTVWI